MPADTLVVRPAIEVLRVRADLHGLGPKGAFDQLEAKLSTLNGRRFYGVVHVSDEGDEYYACVEKLPSEDPTVMGVQGGTIPGGRYVRRRVLEWQSVVRAGKMKQIGQEFARGYTLDLSRPSLEYYRSMTELHLLLPLAASSEAPEP